MTNKSENDNFEYFSQTLQEIRLQPKEKQAVRSQLEEHIENHKPTKWVDISRLLRHSFGRAAMAVAAVVFIIGGVTYAAEDAMPGSALYAVKTNINEPVISFMAWSNSQEAETQSKLAARRIAELQTLLNSNQLTTSTSEKLLSRISAHTQAARREIAELEMTADVKNTQAQELRSRLQALLAVEGEKMQEFLRTATTSTASSNTIVKDAARVLTDLAQADTPQQATTSKSSKLSAGGQAVINLLQVTTDQMQSSYQVYLQRNDPETTPPPQKLVPAAYALESAVEDITADKYENAIKNLEEALQNLDIYASNTSGIAMRSEENPAPDTEQSATSSTQAVDIPSSSKATKTTSGSDTQTPPVGVPTRQALHNDTIKDAIDLAEETLTKYSFAIKEQTNNFNQPGTSTSSAAASSSEAQAQGTTTNTSQTSKSSTTTSDNDESAM